MIELLILVLFVIERSTISELKDASMKMNQHLAEMKSISMEHIEQKLSKQVCRIFSSKIFCIFSLEIFS